MYYSTDCAMSNTIGQKGLSTTLSIHSSTSRHIYGCIHRPLIYFVRFENILHYTCSSGSFTIVLQYHHLFWRHSLNTLERRSIFYLTSVLSILSIFDVNSVNFLFFLTSILSTQFLFDVNSVNFLFFVR